jgi:hypothetical protein
MPLTGERKAEAQRRRRLKKRAALVQCPEVWRADTESQCWLQQGHEGPHVAAVTFEVRWGALHSGLQA